MRRFAVARDHGIRRLSLPDSVEEVRFEVIAAARSAVAVAPVIGASP
jgi:hypothetical protein